eukprot:2006933-Prymnesium_polylepis.1
MTHIVCCGARGTKLAGVGVAAVLRTADGPEDSPTLRTPNRPQEALPQDTDRFPGHPFLQDTFAVLGEGGGSEILGATWRTAANRTNTVGAAGQSAIRAQRYTLRGRLGAIPARIVPFFIVFACRSGQGHGQSPGRARERPRGGWRARSRVSAAVRPAAPEHRDTANNPFQA